MATRKSSSTTSGEVTSAGVPWSEVPGYVDVEWMDGRHGSATQPLPPADQIPIPAVLFTSPKLHPDRQRGTKAMIDAGGARCRLADCRPGAWLLSPIAGWKWAKWPDGEVGWLPAGTALPDSLRARSRNDIQ